MTKVLDLSEKHSLSVEALTMTYPHGDRLLVALQGVSLEVQRGEFVCVVGASGSGKSTLLSLLAGLEQPTRGRAHAHGHVALIFQEAALLPWLTAAGNVELALEPRGVRNPQRSQIAGDLLRRVHLDGWEGRRPHALSGGMKQRVATARPLAHDADVNACRAALQQINVALNNRPEKDRPPSLDPQRRERLQKLFSLSDDDMNEIAAESYTLLDGWHLAGAFLFRAAAPPPLCSEPVGVLPRRPVRRAKPA